MGPEALLGFGLSLAGGFGAAHAQRKFRADQRKELETLERQQRAELDPALMAQEMYLKRSLANQEEGFGSALLDVDRAESLGSRTLQEQAQAGTQAAIGTGALRGGGSVATNAMRASNRDAGRAIAEFQLGLARQRSGIRMQRGQARAAGNQKLGAFQAYRAGARNSLLSRYWDWIAGQQATQTPLQLAGLGQMVGQGGFGSFGGGGGGPQGGGGGGPSPYSPFPGTY